MKTRSLTFHVKVLDLMYVSEWYVRGDMSDRDKNESKMAFLEEKLEPVLMFDFSIHTICSITTAAFHSDSSFSTILGENVHFIGERVRFLCTFLKLN